MLMKDGTTVPIVLMQALENDMDALKIFMNVSETYQKLFVMQITRPNMDLSMKKRVAKTIDDIKRYGHDNGM